MRCGLATQAEPIQRQCEVGRGERQHDSSDAARWSDPNFVRQVSRSSDGVASVVCDSRRVRSVREPTRRQLRSGVSHGHALKSESGRDGMASRGATVHIRTRSLRRRRSGRRSSIDQRCAVRSHTSANDRILRRPEGRGAISRAENEFLRRRAPDLFEQMQLLKVSRNRTRSRRESR